ncbi:hypothetical protein ETD86_46830 [Nonomuraea turkmeniaca]|uniref:Glycosyltransferase RgtA/B/C/D-like domain-containing protein n=1 Tax=Nonomuraea turkmeniaca TaxID=103838 RepID=A0A5S4EYP3_9ACTN|nr:hypothetical protein [Nonomuraea turkmeniaca]TMR08654.1 hypothetical protein ETD86_46830 [Nonomuraea turkmeniaca]
MAFLSASWLRADPWRTLLILVACCYGIVQLIFVTPGMGLGWDESIYVSQVDPRAPAADFIAPRARGITWLVAPVVLVTSSTEALRVYLCLLSALALYASFRIWSRVRAGAVAPLAALLFASLWLALFYGGQAMPNLWVAFGAVAAVGCFLLCVRSGSGRGPVAGLALSVAAVGLLRPPDSLWLVLALAAALAWPAWRRVRVGAALVAGLVVGWADWIAEAYVRFGGFAARWQAAGAANETGLHVSLLEHVRALNGPLLCRPPAHCGPIPLPWLLWASTIPVLVLLGLYAARRRGHLAACALPAVAGLLMGAPYVFLVGYAAPRFLLPAYALLALPIAYGVLRLAERPFRPVLAGLLTAGLLAQFALQGLTLDKVVAPRLAKRQADVEVARALSGLDLRPPCLVYGEHAAMIAYRVGCESHTVLRWPQQSAAPAPIRAAQSAGKQVVAVDEGRHAAAPFLEGWERRPLPGARPGTWQAYLPLASSVPQAGRPAAVGGAGELGHDAHTRWGSPPQLVQHAGR